MIRLSGMRLFDTPKGALHRDAVEMYPNAINLTKKVYWFMVVFYTHENIVGSIESSYLCKIH